MMRGVKEASAPVATGGETAAAAKLAEEPDTADAAGAGGVTAPEKAPTVLMLLTIRPPCS